MRFVVSKKVTGEPLQAIKIYVEQMVETLEGPRTAHAGDWIMTGIKGEKWPIRQDEFKSMYRTVGITEGGAWLVQPIPEKRIGYQCESAFEFENNGEVFKADTHDWIISRPNGDTWPCKPDIFQATYDILESIPD